MSDETALARLLSHPVLIRVCRIGIGLVMLAAALGKIGDPGAFSSQIHHFHLTPIGAERERSVACRERRRRAAR